MASHSSANARSTHASFSPKKSSIARALLIIRRASATEYPPYAPVATTSGASRAAISRSKYAHTVFAMAPTAASNDASVWYLALSIPDSSRQTSRGSTPSSSAHARRPGSSSSLIITTKRFHLCSEHTCWHTKRSCIRRRRSATSSSLRSSASSSALFVFFSTGASGSSSSDLVGTRSACVRTWGPASADCSTGSKNVARAAADAAPTSRMSSGPKRASARGSRPLTTSPSLPSRSASAVASSRTGSSGGRSASSVSSVQRS
mmetsp:Transcript_3416/g.13798  ORF Transcript_3416/g.13798 Transcript_3416/m.13798 type:complete len:262 (+) Transcript_3416:609-1394(+)